jgi:protein ImuB
MFACLHAKDVSQTLLLECAREFSPCVESTAPGTVLLDLYGTERLLGPPQDVGQQILGRAKDMGFDPNVAIAATPDAAMYAALGLQGAPFIPAGQEARRLAPLPVRLLSPPLEMLETFESWGIRTFGELASLPSIPVTERLGQEGLRLQKLARGGSERFLVADESAEDFTASYEFDDPVETLESLAFILNRMTQDLCERLASRALATTEFRIRLELESWQLRTNEEKEVYEHVWKPPLPTSDAKFLCRLVCLDLNEVTFEAPIKKVEVEVVPSRPRATQAGLFAPASPEPERLEITLARIRGIVGSADESGTACVGSPQVLDTHKPDSFAVQAFSALSTKRHASHPPTPTLVLRLFRPELESSVELTGDQPHFVRLWKKHRRVVVASGPWRSSGYWWNKTFTWMRDEWDVALKMPKGIELYRIYLDRLRGKWFVEGMFD